MSNPYFQFKQFKVQQDACGMKVSTDACIQGAWAPVPANALSALDIGTGTGLLSLMLAQRFPFLSVDAVEIDAGAAIQAHGNVQASPFKDRIKVTRADIKDMPVVKVYDYIICNPPFFINSLKGPTGARNHARHDIALTQADLVHILQRHLSIDGEACFLWPESEHEKWNDLLLMNGFFIIRRLTVQDRAHTKVTRVLSVCSKQDNGVCADERLIIKQENRDYAQEFAALLGPFYLHL